MVRGPVCKQSTDPVLIGFHRPGVSVFGSPLKETPLSKEPMKEQNSGVQKQPSVSSSTHVPIISTAVGEMSELSPLSMDGVVYSSTPFTPFYPPCSVPSTSFMPGLVEQHLQTQQPT